MKNFTKGKTYISYHITTNVGHDMSNDVRLDFIAQFKTDIGNRLGGDIRINFSTNGKGVRF